MSDSSSVSRDAMAESAIHQHWVSTYRSADARAFYETAFDAIVEILAAPPDSVILDAGCGSCAKSVLLATRGFRVVGTDFSESALALAADTLQTHGLQERVELRQGNLLDLPFPSGEFRYILCWGVLMHVPDLAGAISELARVLAPGGTLVVSEGNMHSLQSLAIRTLKKTLRRERRQTVRAPAGFETTETTPDGVLLTRETDMTWFVAECRRRDLALRLRLPGQFTELYTIAPGRPLKRLIHFLNHIWFRYVRLAGPAFGNVLVFDKVS